MNYKELVAEGEKRQINQRNEKDGSLCPDKDALNEYYDEKVEAIEWTKEARVARIIKEYKEKREKEEDAKAKKEKG